MEKIKGILRAQIYFSSKYFLKFSRRKIIFFLNTRKKTIFPTIKILKMKKDTSNIKI